MKEMEPSTNRPHGAASAIPPGRTPLTRILAHEAQYWTCVSDVERRDGWALFHNAALIPRLDPNHAGDFRAPEGTGEAIAREIIRFYRDLGAVPLAYVDALSTPTDMVGCLLLAGFRELPGWGSDLMLYVGPDDGLPSLHTVDLVETDADRADWASIVEEDADAAGRQLQRRMYEREIADPRITAYIARVGGRPASRCHLFSSDGLGRIEAVRTLLAYRGRGLAAAVVRRALLDALDRGDLAHIYAEPGSRAQRLYERLGFRTVARNALRGFVWKGGGMETGFERDDR
jgi:GNAT superfamily N-acetyltransferase